MQKLMTYGLVLAFCLAWGLSSAAELKQPDQNGKSKQASKAGKKKKKRTAAMALERRGESTADVPKTVVQPLTPATPGTDREVPPVVAAIDREIARKLEEQKVTASPQADDAEFLRRVSLDLRGRIPSEEETRSFLKDTQDGKRRRVIDEFLADPEYGEHLAIMWYYRLVQENSDNRVLVSDSFRDWMAEHFNRNVRWNVMVRAILTASGERTENPAIVFWLANIDGDSRREISPNRIAASACKAFLGVKIECCECHNHPFDEGLKQTDFWSIAAFFTSTHTANTAPKQVKKEGAIPGIYENDKPIRYPRKLNKEAAPAGSIVIPDSQGKTVDARFLHAAEPDEGQLLRPAFADWLTSPQNAYFAKAAVNRTWANFFGRGLIDPPDDLRAASGATHPELLDLLAAEFVASGFDLKHLVRCICNSQAYQRTSLAAAGNDNDTTYYSHMGLRMQSADMLFDSLTVALDHEPANKARAGGNVRKRKRKTAQAREEFLKYFHAEADDDAGVTEDYTHGIPQALRLMNSDALNDLDTVVQRLTADTSGPKQIIEAIYIRVLSRLPRESEMASAQRYLQSSDSTAKGAHDLMWALLNSSEFLFNH